MSISILVFLFFWLALIVSAGLAIIYGGRPEKLGGLVMVLGAVSSAIVVADIQTRFQGIELGLLLADLGMLGALIVLMLNSTRFWPIWANSFQLAAIITHIAAALMPKPVADAYAVLQGFWAYPILATLLLGTYGYRRSLTMPDSA